MMIHRAARGRLDTFRSPPRIVNKEDLGWHDHPLPMLLVCMVGNARTLTPVNAGCVSVMDAGLELECAAA